MTTTLCIEHVIQIVEADDVEVPCEVFHLGFELFLGCAPKRTIEQSVGTVTNSVVVER